MTAQSFKELIRPTLEGVRLYWPVMVGIQVAALITVLAYYFIEGTSEFFARVSDIQERGGLVFAGISTVISGGVIPEVLKRMMPSRGSRPPGIAELANQFMMWAGMGILIERFYALQNFLFGSTDAPGILLAKVAVDQLIFTPLIPLPFMVACFMLYESGYRLNVWLHGFSLKTWKRRVLPLWITCLSYWPVMLLVVYSLPHTLQFPLFIFANAAFSILMIFIARRQALEIKDDS